MIKKSGRSPCYVMTIDLSSPEDLSWLRAFREHNVGVNALGKQFYGEQAAHKRVIVRYRRPIEKTRVFNWRSNKAAISGYDFAGNLVGGAANAREADVYLYDRRD
jgi:hypothetical protein